MKKSLLFLITSVLCLSAGHMNAIGHTHTLVNKTDKVENKNAHFWTHYVACSGDVAHLSCGDFANKHVGLCCINRVEACVGDGHDCHAQTVWDASDSSYGMYCGNATWNLLNDNTCCFLKGDDGEGELWVSGKRMGKCKRGATLRDLR